MVTRVPAAPEVLVWARKACGLSVPEAAQRLGIKPALLEKIEGGDPEPSVTNFRNMARVYALPEATLMSAAPPELPQLPTDHRTFDGIAPSLSYKTIVAIRRVQDRHNVLVELSEIDPEIVPPKLPRLTMRNNPIDAGEQARADSAITVREQLQMRPNQAFMTWRLLLEGYGISVFVEDFPVGDSRGVSIFDNGFPAIILPRDEKHDGARCFTLMHEFAHLLLRQPGISDQNRTSKIERFCNQFAAGFLMPAEAIRVVIGRRPDEPVEYEAEDLSDAANRLSVSLRALALRLEELEYAPEGYFNRINALLGRPAKRPTGEKSAAIPQEYLVLSHMGHNYTDKVLHSFEHGLISSVEASRLIGTRPTYFDRLRDTLRGRWAALGRAG